LKHGEATSDDLNSHPHSDQTVLVLEGELLAEVGEESHTLHSGQSLIIPATMKHRLRNQANEEAFAFTIYAPPAYEVDDPT
jgi:quercetin dioxygenase-like cupin family protein